MEVMENVGLVPNSARGLRVLLVDNDTISLMYLASVLEEKSYKVTTTELPTVALSLIRDRKGQYDLVIADINMLEMDGFIFLKQILLHVDIPIIMMSVDPNEELARKALNEGACFFFRKPIPIRHLINVWQHVFRKKRCITVETEESEGNSIIQTSTYAGASNIQPLPVDIKGKSNIIENEFVDFEQRCVREPQRVIIERWASLENGKQGEFEAKRESNEIRKINTNNFSRSLIHSDEERQKNKRKRNTEKKSGPRLRWTPDLHHKFMEALSTLGEKEANPKAVLRLMNVPHLTHRHVASHLQKYRERIKRISYNCEINPPMQTKPTFNFYGTNKSNFGPTPVPVTRPWLNISTPVYYNLETLKRQLQSANFNTDNKTQIGVQDNGKGKQPLGLEGQCGNFASVATSVANQEVNYAREMDPARSLQDPTRFNNGGNYEGVGSPLDYDAVMKMLETDEFEELLGSSPSGFDDDLSFSGGSFA